MLCAGIKTIIISIRKWRGFHVDPLHFSLYPPPYASLHAILLSRRYGLKLALSSSLGHPVELYVINSTAQPEQVWWNPSG